MTFAIGDQDLPGLSKLTEEAGELLQVVGELMAVHGMTKGWDGTDLRARLVAELADISAAIHFVINKALTAKEARTLMARFRDKYAKFEQWHAEQGDH